MAGAGEGLLHWQGKKSDLVCLGLAMQVLPVKTRVEVTCFAIAHVVGVLWSNRLLSQKKNINRRR